MESGKIDAAKSEAFNNPKANRYDAHFPASGASAAAAWAASVMVVMPFLFNVAAQQTMMKNTIAIQVMLPTSTSSRACLYCLGPTRFSTNPA